MTRAARCLTAVAVLASSTLAPAALAFDVSPPSATVQAGNDVTAVLAPLPLDPGGSPTCVETSAGTSVYVTAVFNPTCGGQPGWSSTMTIKTIPATASGSYQIVIDVCLAPGCGITAGVRTTQPVETRSWTLQVTPAPVPVETTTPAPLPAPAPSPAATGRAPAPRATQRSPAPTPTRAGTSPGPSPSAAIPPSGPSPSPAPSALSLGAAPQLTLDRPSVTPGGNLVVSGMGCTPSSTAVLDVAGAVSGTATAGADGRFRAELRLPSSVHPGRYEVVARCGAVGNTLVDVTEPHRSRPVAVLVGAVAVAALLVGLAIGVLTQRRRGSRGGS